MSHETRLRLPAARRVALVSALIVLMLALAGMGRRPNKEIPTINFKLVVPVSKGQNAPPSRTGWMTEDATRRDFLVPPCTLSARVSRVRIAITKNWCCDSVLLRLSAHPGRELFRRVVQAPPETLFYENVDLTDGMRRKLDPGLYFLELSHYGSGQIDGRLLVLGA